MLAPIGNQIDLTGLGIAPPQAERKDELGQEEFLHLMVTQLENQDPFKPLESGEFLGQLAQFGTVSGLAGLQTKFDQLAGALVSNQALQAAGLVGRSVLAASGAAAIGAGEGLSGAIELPESSTDVRVQIRDALGQVVRELDLGTQSAGLVRFEWDGADAGGEPAPAGSYGIAAQYRAGNETEAADVLLSAPVDSVLMDASGFRVQLRGIGELPFTAVREISSL
jgi:flagellar basal-body rod modification protein FlgD